MFRDCHFIVHTYHIHQRKWFSHVKRFLRLWKCQNMGKREGKLDMKKIAAVLLNKVNIRNQVQIQAIAWENSHDYVEKRSQSSNFVVSFLWNSKKGRLIYSDWKNVNVYFSSMADGDRMSGSKWKKEKGTIHNSALHSYNRCAYLSSALVYNDCMSSQTTPIHRWHDFVP